MSSKTGPSVASLMVLPTTRKDQSKDSGLRWNFNFTGPSSVTFQQSMVPPEFSVAVADTTL
jgi:hypothetical protein